MNMNKALKAAIVTGAFILVGLAGWLIWKSNRDSQMQKTCEGLKVKYTDQYTFVTPTDIEEYLKNDYGAYIGQRLDSVDLEKVERILDSKSAVLKAEAYTTPDGYLNVKISQRSPVVRFQKGDVGFYADERGFLFPLQDNFTSRVPVIDGNVPLSFESGYKGEPGTDREKEWLAQAIDLANYIKASKIWSGNISQMTVNEEGDIVMVPRNGEERFIFGTPDDAQSKFDKIGKYYTAIIPAKGEGVYKTVNVKYKGQIVCRK